MIIKVRHKSSVMFAMIDVDISASRKIIVIIQAIDMQESHLKWWSGLGKLRA